MSDFHYYEFQKIDRSLTPKEISEIQQLSSRVKISGKQATFVYHYGSFRGDLEQTLASYFDVMLSVSNYGSKQLSFRLPCPLVNLKELKVYEYPHVVTIKTINDYFILSLRFTQEEFGWVEEDDVSYLLSLFLPLWRDILLGDYRCLYLALLAHSQDAEDLELQAFPTPPNLQNLSDSLSELALFFEIFPETLKVIAGTSRTLDSPKEDVRKLSKEEMTDYLEQLLRGESFVDIKLRQRLAQQDSETGC